MLANRAVLAMGTRMRLLAIADLHLAIPHNREALRALPTYPTDWLIVAGDLCEDAKLFAEALAWLASCFARVIWVPGNHELWLTDRDATVHGSVRKYAALVDIARRLGVVTPEDAFPAWPPTGEIIVPLCTLYDYSFRPEEVALCDVVRWAAELSNVAADEELIDPAPLAGMAEWCALRCAATEARFVRELPNGAYGAHRPLPAARGSGPDTAHPPLHTVVWHATNRRMAHPISRRCRGQRTSACAPHRLARRHPV
jgi:hypothetical protein